MRHLKNFCLLGLGFTGGAVFAGKLILSKELKNKQIRHAIISEAANKLEHYLFKDCETKE